jgi:hypothetical protein
VYSLQLSSFSLEPEGELGEEEELPSLEDVIKTTLLFRNSELGIMYSIIE